MERIKFILGVVICGALCYWLYPARFEAIPEGRTSVMIWFNGPFEGRHLEAIDSFERQFDAYHAVIGSSAVRTNLEGEGNPQRLMCGIAGGVPPEVVEYDRFAICQWAARGAFMDLTPLIERDLAALDAAKTALEVMEQRAGDSPTAHEREVIAAQRARIAEMEAFVVRSEDYFEPTWDECKYQGGVYGIPNYMDDRVLYYNRNLLVRAGFVDDKGAARPPETWEEILDKRVDAADAVLDDKRVRCDSVDFVTAGVREGDTLVHVSDRGLVTRCLVGAVEGAHVLRVRSPYADRDVSLPKLSSQHIKVFDQDGYLLRLSQWDDEGRLKTVGFEPQHGNAWLYLYGWANGGRFMTDDGRTCTLNDPRIVEALTWTVDIYDALGGFDRAEAFRKSYQERADHPFYKSQIAMFINGDWFLRDLARYAGDLRFGTHRPPVPRDRYEAGHEDITWVAGFAYCIPATCPEDKIDAAWSLVKYLSSVTGGMVMNEHDAQRERGQGRLYMPRLMANRNLLEAQFERYIDISQMPDVFRAAIRTHVSLLPHGMFRPVSPQGQLLWNAQADAQNIAWSHTMTPQAALDYQSDRVNRALVSFYEETSRGPPVNWSVLVWGYVGLLIATGVLVWLRFRMRNRARGFYRHEWYAGVAFIVPWLVGFVILSGGPIVFSGMLSFMKYDVINPARWVGLDHYQEMFTIDWGGPDVQGQETVPTGVRKALYNTVYMTIGLPIGMVIGLGLALLVSRPVRGIGVYRTLFFIPAIMPVVAASILWLWVFNAQNGLLNWMLRLVGIEQALNYLSLTVDWINVQTPISWLTNKHTSKMALIIMLLWGAGSSMIIWLSGIKEIPTHLYEAASLDGAGMVRRFFTITLPLLTPYILFNLIIGIIQTFQIFTQAYIMTPNGYPERSTYFYVYKLFDESFTYFRLGYGAAMAWFLFAILIVLTLLNMHLSKRWVFYAGD